MSCVANRAVMVSSYNKVVSPLYKDLKWALMKAGTEQEEAIAVGDSCELCYKLWQKAFNWLSFESLAEMAEDSTTALHKHIALARDRMKQGLDPLPGGAVTKVSAVKLEVSRSFLVASEKELASESTKGKVSKSVLKNLVGLEVPAESGSGTEQVYAFQDPAQKLRKMDLKVYVNCEVNTSFLQHDQQQWDGQTDKLFEHLTDQSASETNYYSELLSKSAHLPVFSEWVTNSLNKQVDEGGQEVELGADEEFDPSELTGVAALPGKALVPGSFFARSNSGGLSTFSTPPSTQKRQGASGSGSVVDGHAPSESGTVTETLMDASASSDQQEIDKWMAKISYEKVLDKSQDLRSLAGLKSWLDRSAEHDLFSHARAMLTSFWRNGCTLKELAKAKVITMEQMELDKCLDLLEAEKTTIPLAMQKDLLARRVKMMSGQHEALLQVLSPYEEAVGKFDCKNPLMSNLETEQSDRLMTFYKTVMEDMFVPWLKDGSKSSSIVHAFCNAAIKVLGEADLIIHDVVTCREHAEQQIVWRGVSCLLRNPPDLTDKDQ
eukprot:4526983-Amphidinium_carterae.1